MKKVVGFAIGSLVMVIASLSLAQAIGLDDRGNPNNPTVNERANACFEGGTLEGKCITDAEWNGGWYLIRFQQGILTRGQIPDTYTWILPPDNPSITNPELDFPAPATTEQPLGPGGNV